MKFSTLLKANKVQGWEDCYIDYSALVKFLKTDKLKFQKLMCSEYNKITKFFNIIEEQTNKQKNELFKLIGVDLDDDMMTLNAYKVKRSQMELISNIDKISRKRDFEKITQKFLEQANQEKAQESITESDISVGGEESDYELASLSTINNKKENKKRLFNFDPFKINKPFEKRKKEKAFHEILQAINSVKSFRDINFMGMSIIIRKYKNKYCADQFTSDFLKKLHASHFCKSRKVDIMQSNVRYIYKKIFADDKSQAKTIFNRIGKKIKFSPMITFAIGITLTILLFIFLKLDFENCKKVKKVAYCFGLIHLGAFLFGICDILFIRYNINYNLIFNFDVISTFTPIELILCITVVSNLTFLLCFLISFDIPEKFICYTIFGLNIIPIIIPIDILWYKSRLYIISVFFGTLVSGFRKVYFKHFFFADVFQSFTPCFKILFFEFGLPKNYCSMLFLNTLFPLIRVLQCINRYYETRASFPHIFNMSKYTLVTIIGITNAFLAFHSNNFYLKNCKILFSFITCTYSIFWDIFLDWTLFRPKKMYPIYFYVVGTIYNCITRYIWIFESYGIYKNEYGFMCIEVIRRFVWALLRVENEHVNNCASDQSKMGLLFSKELFFIKDTNDNVTDNIKNEYYDEEEV